MAIDECIGQWCSTMRNSGNTYGPQCFTASSIAQVASTALLIIGALAVAGVFPGSPNTIGWTMIGLGAGGAIISCFAGKPKERRYQIIFSVIAAATFIGVGAAGVSGVLNTHQLGVAALVMTLAGGICCAGSYMAYDLEKNKCNRNG